MAGNFTGTGTFTMDLVKFCEKTKIKPLLVVKKIAFDMASRIIQRTPRDTGRAAAGWQVGINEIPGYLPPEGNYPYPPAPMVPTFKLGDDIYIANNVEYITVLEDGHSQQAPRGMVKVTITEFQSFVAKAVASL